MPRALVRIYEKLGTEESETQSCQICVYLVSTLGLYES